MNRKMTSIAIAAFLLALAGNTWAGNPLLTSYTNVFGFWEPLIFIVVMLSMMIAGIYYMIGILLNNSSVKERAVNEFGQAVGIAIIVVLVVAVLSLLGGIFLNMFSTTAASNICNTLTGSYLGLTFNGLINGNPANTMTTEVCSLAESASKSNDFTSQIDYGLASSYLIAANLTNQSASNLQGFYMFESYIGFLKTFQVVDGVCTTTVPAGCWSGVIPREESVLIEYTPLFGYGMITIMSTTLEEQANLLFYFYVLQLLLMGMAIYAWPFLLAGGMLLRATYFGRRAGGLMMAMALGLLIFLPLMMLLEYSAFSNSSVSPVGATNMPVLVINETQPGTSTTTVYASNSLNVYVFPKTAWIANRYGCWPNGNGNLGLGEADFAWWYLVPGFGILYFITGLFSGFASQLPALPPGNTCTPSHVMTAIFNMVNAYGVMSVSGFILPLFNIMILFAGIKGISYLFGGDTNLAGIGKLV